MNEKRTRKDWIKNIAIVFLAIMLVLTFFSNTIMNYSLPEVAVKYVESGSITAKIRGTGTVESGDPYYVTIPQQRNVEAVMVRVGDVVEKGQVLAILASEDSAEAEAAYKTLEAAKKAFEDYLLTGDVNSSVMNNAGNTSSVNTYKQQITDLQNQMAAYENDIEDLQEDLDSVKNQIEALTVQISITNVDNVGSDAERKAYSDAKKALEAAQKKQVEAQNTADYYEDYVDVSSGDAIDAAAVTDAKNALIVANKELADAQAAYDNAKAVLENQVDSTKNNLQNQLNDQNVNQFHLNTKIAEKQKSLDEVKKTFEELTKNIGDARTLASLQDAINEAQEAYDKLKSDEISGEVVAPFAGTIVTVPISSGNPTMSIPENGSGYTIATMQKDGKGYTMSFSVTNEQARKITVGDPCTLVNSWRYNDMTVTVSAIKNDTSSQGKNKLIVCDVEGEYVTPGQSVSVSVGEKSASYDLIVPNSAIREDNNGKFVLIVESKSTPLGNRYTATRVDIEVLAADDTQSAITGALYGWEYVITTATAPVEAGKQVRLANN